VECGHGRARSLQWEQARSIVRSRMPRTEEENGEDFMFVGGAKEKEVKGKQR
jgi:hypothetical protein